MKSYTTQNGTIFSSSQVAEICERIDKGHDWQAIINDEIWQEVGCDDDNAQEIYNHCEILVQEASEVALSINF
jgi:hypothetical protein